ncbi:MAG: class I mannose-6-phosphate isomerase [Oscillospiraceae bacterium]|nr:class I mannose-6-phosphate isomerase [Oscillospiraceae bacterium]
MYMLKLSPAGKDYLWGGTRLKTEYHKKFDFSPLAETWECSVHPDGASTVLNGEHAGMTLDKIIARYPEYLGKKYDYFPILVKFIDAEKDLSIQVHPDDNYARFHENQNGKTEMWYVMDATENAFLIHGFEKNFTKQEVKQAIENHEIMKYLHKVPVQKGDVIYIPAGTVHAIGKGILIAEIQENSNITYRVYDYDRLDKNGNRRELHIEKALEVMHCAPAPEIIFDKNFFKNSDYEIETLCNCNYFKIKKIMIKKYFNFFVTTDSFQVLLCLDGISKIIHEQEIIKIKKGDCVFLPAGLGNCKIQGNAELLKIKC